MFGERSGDFQADYTTRRIASFAKPFGLKFTTEFTESTVEKEQ